MKIHFYTASSLDGFLATEEHSLEWLFRQDIDIQGPMAYPAFIEGVGALVMGSSTYEWLQRHDSTWNYSQPAWVFTHRELKAFPDADIRFVQGTVGKLFPQILESALGRDVWVVGGGDLAGQFADEGLLDELWVQFAPVTLGSGRPLLPRVLDLELLETVRNRDFVCTHYRVLSATR